MTEQEIEEFRLRQRDGRPLFWLDPERKIHRVTGFRPNFREHEDDEPEPVAVLEGGKVVALHNVVLGEFETLAPAFS